MQVIKGFAAKSDGKDKLTALVQVSRMASAAGLEAAAAQCVHCKRTAGTKGLGSSSSHFYMLKLQHGYLCWPFVSNVLFGRCCDSPCIAVCVLPAVPVSVPVSGSAWSAEEGSGFSHSSTQGVPHHAGEDQERQHSLCLLWQMLRLLM